MTLLNRKPQDRYATDRAQADRSIKAQLDFILANLSHLAKVDSSGKLQRAAKSFRTLLANGETLTPNQRNYIEGIYESVMKGAGFETVGVHHDKPRKGLRFG